MGWPRPARPPRAWKWECWSSPVAAAVAAPVGRWSLGWQRAVPAAGWRRRRPVPPRPGQPGGSGGRGAPWAQGGTSWRKATTWPLFTVRPIASQGGGGWTPRRRHADGRRPGPSPGKPTTSSRSWTCTPTSACTAPPRSARPTTDARRPRLPHPGVRRRAADRRGALWHPVVQSDRAWVEYWARFLDQQGTAMTLAGCAVARFAGDGRIAEARDYWHLEHDHRPPPPQQWGR
jgi:hypothetical protein